MAFPHFKLQFQLTLDFSCLHKQHLKSILTAVEVVVDQQLVETHTPSESLFSNIQDHAGLSCTAIHFACNIPYESEVYIRLRYRKKPAGEILLSDSNPQRFWQSIPADRSASKEDISVPIAINIRGLPVATGRLGIDRSAVKAFLNVVNGARYPNPTGLPTIENLQSLIYKLGNYSIHNERAFKFAGLHLYGLMVYVDNYPQDKVAYMSQRKLVDHEGQPVDLRNLRYNAAEDLLSHMRRVVDFAVHCTSILSFPGCLSDHFQELIHYVALGAESLCVFARIYLFATYAAAASFNSGAMDIFWLRHHSLLYCRAKFTLAIKRMSEESRSLPKPDNSRGVLSFLYHKAKTELRIDPNWPIESFTAALMYVCGPVFDTIIHWIRRDIIASESDARTRDMLRRLAVHMIQEAGIIPAQLMTLPGRLTLAKADDADRQKKALPVGEGSYASVYQGCYTPPKPSTQMLSLGQTPKTSFVALKCMRFFSNGTPEDMRNQRQRMILELVNTWMLSHEYILSLTAVLFKPELSPFTLVLPWMPKSNVRVRLRQLQEKPQKFDGKLHNLSNRWLGQIAIGLEYVHLEGIVHGDLRGVNVLVDQQDSIKIADFGLSLYAEGMSKNYASAREGNPAWTAPEIIDTKTMTRLRATHESDIYSFAMVCIELWTLADPMIYPGSERPNRPSSPDLESQDQMPDGLWRVVNQCWDKDPKKRLTASQLNKELRLIGIVD